MRGETTDSGMPLFWAGVALIARGGFRTTHDRAKRERGQGSHGNHMTRERR